MRVDHREDTGLVAVGIGTLLVLLFNAYHAPYMFWPVGVLFAVMAIKPLRLRAEVWYVMAAVWVPPLVLDWVHFEDHSYVAMYWTLAFGLALHGADPWPVLKHHARHLVGLLMGAAALWKLLTPAFHDGRLFEWVLVHDERFAPLLSRLAGGLDEATWSVGHSAARRMMWGTEVVETVSWTVGPRTDLLIALMVGWTLLSEVGLAVAFLAPDDHVLARLRAPLLLAFCWALYPVVPILGFAVLLPLLGAVVDHDKPRVVAAYGVSVMVFLALWFGHELAWQQALASAVTG